MDNFNTLVKIVRETMPLVQSGIPAVVGGFITAMFMRGNTKRAEFEKIKIGKLSEVIDSLVSNHELTLTELVKCKNLIKIAELADREYSKLKNECNTESEFEKIKFDWFFKFFDSAGDVSDEEMQLLWAKILAGEINEAGSIPLYLIHILSIIDSKSATDFSKLCNFSWEVNIFNNKRIYPVIWVLEGEDDSFFSNLGIDFRMLYELDSYGLVRFDYQSGFSIKEEFLFFQYFDNTISLKTNNNEIRTGSVMLTHTGESLYKLIDKRKDDNYINECISFWERQGYILNENFDIINQVSKCAEKCYSDVSKIMCSSLRKSENFSCKKFDYRDRGTKWFLEGLQNNMFNDVCYKKNCKKRKTHLN